MQHIDLQHVVRLEYKLSECDDLEQLRAQVQADIAASAAAAASINDVMSHVRLCIANLQQNLAARSAGSYLPFVNFACAICILNDVQ